MSLAAPAITGLKPLLVTGGAGFIGSNLADRLAREGEHVLILDALARRGVEQNISWLKARHSSRVSAIIADIRDASAIADAAEEASAVFHFAAQVAVTSSFLDPEEDFSVNVRATLRLLELLRRLPGPAPLIFSSTNKVYGDLADIPLEVRDGVYQPTDEVLRGCGISEERSLDFHTPYGCSKGAAEQYVLDYARSFGMPTAVMRMSCIYGPRQIGTEDQGWVAHFVLRILTGEPISIYGDGRQVRDILFIDDAVEAYIRAWRGIRKIAGRAFNLGGGPANAVSLLQVIAHAEQLLSRKVETCFYPWRPGDQLYYVSDTRRVSRCLDLSSPLGWQNGIGRLVQWLKEEAKPQRLKEEAKPQKIPERPVRQSVGA
jgi:CDP-paratose 2-epimerase